MTRREKLIAKLRARPTEADFRDVQALLVEYGWTFARQKGSHATFTKAGEIALFIPLRRGRKVTRPYVDAICNRLGLD